MTDTSSSMMLFASTRTAISVNGRLYLNSGTIAPNGDFISYINDSDPSNPRTNLGKGRSLLFVIDLKRMCLSLSRSDEDRLDMHIPFDTPFEVYRDLITFSDPKYIPRPIAKFSALQTQRDASWEFTGIYMRQRRVGKFVMDGYIIETHRRKELIDAIKIEMGDYVAKAFMYVPVNAMAYGIDTSVVVADWDGFIHQIGSSVFATSKDERDKLREIVTPFGS